MILVWVAIDYSLDFKRIQPDFITTFNFEEPLRAFKVNSV
jgi:hypothetical protein